MAEPLYCTGATVVPRRKDCKADAVPPSTRLAVPEPLTTETLPAAAADKLPEVVLKVRVSASSAAVLPSSIAALVKSRAEGWPVVMARVTGSALITGDMAAFAEAVGEGQSISVPLACPGPDAFKPRSLRP